MNDLAKDKKSMYKDDIAFKTKQKCFPKKYVENADIHKP